MIDRYSYIYLNSKIKIVFYLTGIHIYMHTHTHTEIQLLLLLSNENLVGLSQFFNLNLRMGSLVPTFSILISPAWLVLRPVPPKKLFGMHVA